MNTLQSAHARTLTQWPCILKSAIASSEDLGQAKLVMPNKAPRRHPQRAWKWYEASHAIVDYQPVEAKWRGRADKGIEWMKYPEPPNAAGPKFPDQEYIE